MWFTRLWSREEITPELIARDRAALATRSNREIAERLMRRAAAHDGSNMYLARCSTLDRIAAARIVELERRLANVQGCNPIVEDE